MKSAAQKACCCGPSASNPDATPPGAADQTHDPVCGMVVHSATAKHRAEHDGQTYYFCCGGCKAKFLADPARFLKPADKAGPSVSGASTAPLTAGTIYTCPMHPQMRRN